MTYSHLTYEIKCYENRIASNANQLPELVQEQASQAYALWRTEPYHKSLQLKRVSHRQLIKDNSTAFLMTEFYRNWQQNPDKAAGLRQAMLTTMK